VTFTSPGAVHGLAALAGSAGLGAQVRAALSGPVRAAVVGPVTRGSANDAGYVPVIEPATHRSGALLRAVMDWWRTRQ
jgi:uroporphyrinogen-III synthase